MKKVSFFIRSNDPSVASNRYRIYSPAIYLRNLGYETTVHVTHPTKLQLDEAAVAIFGKSISLRELAIATQFKQRKKQVYLDICDNVFHESYYNQEHKDNRSSALRGLLNICDGVLVPGAAMKAIVVRETLGRIPVHIIPDPVENLSDISLMEELAANISEMQSKGSDAGKAAALAEPEPNEGLRRPGRGLFASVMARFSRADVMPVDEDLSPPVRAILPATTNLLQFGDGLPPTVIWFGNAGNGFSSFGLRSLALIMPDIVAASRQVPLRLLVVSNSERLFKDLIEPFPVETVYRTWSARDIYYYLRNSNVCVLPLFADEFSRGKSNNRILLSLAQGTPVIASQANAPTEMLGHLLVDDWTNSVVRYLKEPETVEAHLASAKIVLEAFSPQRCAELLAAVIEAQQRGREARPIGTPRERVVFLIQFAADYALLQPLWRAAAATQNIECQIVVLSSVLYGEESFAEALRNEHMSILVLGESDTENLTASFVGSINALVTASETSLRPHRVAHKMTQLVNEAGGATFTMQHGLENVGLTYADQRQGADVKFASQHILTWGPPNIVGAFVEEDTRRKVLPIGITKSLRGRDALKVEALGGGGYVAIFENLHWLRYDDRFRARFLEDLSQFLADFPEERFVLKPHPAGKWLTGRYKGEVPSAPNLTILDPAAPTSFHITGEDLAANAKLVLSTPSTIVLDAAREDVPVAVINYDLRDTSIYEPIARLRAYAEWASLLRATNADPRYGHAERQDFLRRMVVAPPLGMTVVDKALQTIRSHLR